MIPIQNVYYMLTYAFQVLNENGYKKIATEQFENMGELCAEILIKGVSYQLKRGLGRDYISQTDSLSTPRGKLNISESIKSNSVLKRQLTCTYDDFSLNSPLNQIIKTTMELLVKSDISSYRRKKLKKLLVYFTGVSTVDVHKIEWHICFNRNTQSYRMLIGICYLVIKDLLLSHTEGSTKLMDFLDEQKMCRLYEKFILEYYRREHKELKAKASQIPWQLDDDMSELLPIMQTDITLAKGSRVLIIDAKYYEHTLQTQYGVSTIHSNNLYQIFTYVKNKEAAMQKQKHTVSGMLLYAGTDEKEQPNKCYLMSGNQISVQTLNLNCPFLKIAEQLDRIAVEFFDDRI